MKKKRNYLFYFPKQNDIYVVNIVHKLSSSIFIADKGLYLFSSQELGNYKLG